MLRMSTCCSYNNWIVASIRAYHHGNLKEAILDAAAVLVGEAGPQAFTLREVARRVGVSHNAPYRHFKDKDELLAAVAAQGFERLTAAMKKSTAKGTTALDRLRLCGRGYIEFAVHWPEHFLVMFDLPSSAEKYPEYAVAGDEAFQVLARCIAAAQDGQSLPAGDPQPLALVAWSLVHGIAKLAISHRLPFSSPRLLEFANYAAAAVVRGMQNLPHPGGLSALR
jgi:AcrR family transcriptional regulator